ncbi:ABC transporter permease [Labrys wisconsinensis]|uniref:NitT/TauT family transport system permease protein n=1 Tax=Labrys wisconsinensis TaxID=425677 RepID=A0ABU0JLQ1_9HYPH|nr:ABC transporter permease [Labrys wisconsinensis]MDQ0475219.1 NitT/TauT family transport system permease protein [Labrys wisconsinensis]
MSTPVASLSVQSPAPPKAQGGTLKLHSLAERQRRRQRLVLALRLAVLIVMLGGWELGVRAGAIDPFFFGQPSGIAAKLVEWIRDGTSIGPLWFQVWVTIYEAGAGFLIGSVLGILCGVVLGRNALLADVFSIYIKIANSIPRVVLGSIFIVALGLGAASKIALAVVMVFFVVFANAFQGVREADKNLIANARILGASRWAITRSVVMPSALSWILASLHVSFGFALVGAIVGEFLGARQGMGMLIATAQGSFDANGVFTAMIVIAVVALIAEGVLTLIEERLMSWRPEKTAGD